MKISDLIQKYQRTYSFEFFPPKDEITAVDFGINVEKLSRLSPSFVSVTYGAGGSQQSKTFDLVDFLQNKIGFTTIAHYTCVNSPKEKIKEDFKWLKGHNIENAVLLRGDIPKGQTKFIPHPNGFEHASQMMHFVKEQFDISIGGAAYPEKHPESNDWKTEIIGMKAKVEAGCEFFVTQLFFDNNAYLNLVKKARAAGITQRIIPGIIPLTSYQQIERFTKMSQASIPKQLLEEIEANKNDKNKIYQIGMDYTIKQCYDLLILGAPGLHFYTLNKSQATIEIFESLIR